MAVLSGGSGGLSSFEWALELGPQASKLDKCNEEWPVKYGVDIHLFNIQLFNMVLTAVLNLLNIIVEYAVLAAF